MGPRADAEALAGHDHVELLRAAAWTTYREHDPAAPSRYLRAAIAELGDGDPERTAALLELLARKQFEPGPGAEAAETRRGRSSCCPTGRAGAGDAARGMAKELMLESRYQEAVDAADEALEVARAAGDEISELRALDAKGVVAVRARLRRRGRAGAARGDGAREGRRPRDLLHTHVNLADVARVAGRLARGAHDRRRGLASCREPAPRGAG